MSKKKRFIKMYREYWGSECSTLKSVGCESLFDETAVVLLGILVGLIKVLYCIFLVATAFIWLPIYILICWIDERRYKK